MNISKAILGKALTLTKETYHGTNGPTCSLCGERVEDGQTMVKLESYRVAGYIAIHTNRCFTDFRGMVELVTEPAAGLEAFRPTGV